MNIRAKELNILCALNEREQRVLNLIQQNFPLDSDPYQVLADALDDGADDVHAAVSALYARGIIRRIGAFFDAAKLGYASTLVAARVAEDALEHSAQLASSFPEVTHNYQRDGAYNLWFTIIAAQQQLIDEILNVVRACAGVLALAQLPARRIFKLRVNFSFPIGDALIDATVASRQSSSPENSDIVLSDSDRQLIARVSGDLGTTRHPYRIIATELNLTEEALLRRLRDFYDAGVQRRLGAVLRHQLTGFNANGLTVWDVPESEMARVAELLAAIPAISHCYERPRLPDWPYNLYAMLHALTRESCEATAAKIAATAGINAYRILYSVREFKKTSLQYFTPG